MEHFLDHLMKDWLTSLIGVVAGVAYIAFKWQAGTLTETDFVIALGFAGLGATARTSKAFKSEEEKK